MSIIFLAGVHGVGKGFFGAQVASNLSISHATASQLIREEKGRATWEADKSTAELDDNQLALIRAVDIRRNSGQDCLLDGHFVLRDPDSNFVRIESDVFFRLQLTGVILLTEDFSTIASRLMQRDGIVVDQESIVGLAREELFHAKAVCGTLNLPLEVLYRPNLQIITETVVRLLTP